MAISFNRIATSDYFCLVYYYVKSDFGLRMILAWEWLYHCESIKAEE